MAHLADSKELRKGFVAEFMWNDDIDTDGLSMADILDIYDGLLGEAKARWGRHIHVDAQMAEATHWLSDRGYADSGGW